MALSGMQISGGTTKAAERLLAREHDSNSGPNADEQYQIVAAGLIFQRREGTIYHLRLAASLGLLFRRRVS